MTNILHFNGYNFNVETREITFTTKTCWDCKGNTVVERGILCPRYGKKVAGLPGRVCEHCGAKNKDSHKVVDTETRNCGTCNATGILDCNPYSSLDYSPLIQFINIVTMDGLRSATLNESYLGMGIIGGVTDYGRYLEETGRDMEKIMAHIRAETEERSKYTQGLNLLKKDSNILIDTAVLKLRADGWSLFSVDANHSIVASK